MSDCGKFLPKQGKVVRHTHICSHTYTHAHANASACDEWHSAVSSVNFSWCGLQESWYEKLNRWDEALEAYNRKYQETPMGSAANLEAALGRLRSHPTLPCVSVHLSLCLCVSLSALVSACLSVCLSACLPACLPAYLSPLSLSARLSCSSSAYLFVCMICVNIENGGRGHASAVCLWVCT